MGKVFSVHSSGAIIAISTVRAEERQHTHERKMKRYSVKVGGPNRSSRTKRITQKKYRQIEYFFFNIFFFLLCLLAKIKISRLKRKGKKRNTKKRLKINYY